MDISNVIDMIRKRPGMYLGSKSITALNHFLNGYQFAKLEHNSNGSERLFPLNFRFMNEFTKIQLGNNDNLGWCNHILNVCDGNEEKALDRFFDIYDEFRKVKAKRYWKAILSDDNIRYNDNMEYCYSIKEDKKKPVFKNPIAVYIVELTIPAYILLVEEEDNVHVEWQFFTSFESAKGSSVIPIGAEQYFGKINLWQEFVEENINFLVDESI